MEPIKGNNVNNDLPIQSVNVNEPQGPILKLPPEILRVIFSQMNNLENQQLNSVSSLWNVEVLNAVKDEELKLLDSFVNALIKKLELIAENMDSYDGLGLDVEVPKYRIEYQGDKSPDVRKKDIEVVNQGLAEILKNIKITQPFDLLKIKSSLMDEKNKIIDLFVGSELYSNIIFILGETLKNEKMPSTWALEVFPIYSDQGQDQIFNVIDELKWAKMESPFGNNFSRGCINLFNLGYLDRAIDLVKKVPDAEQWSVFKYIINQLADNNHFDKAAQIAIENPTHHEYFSNLISSLAHRGKVDLAIKVCNSIKDVKARDSFLYVVNHICLQKNNYEGAIKVCALINDDLLRSEAKDKILIELLSQGKEFLQNNPDLLNNLKSSI